ncbi:MAG: M4 family metallopeptidase, partial [Bacteroidia bacterium]|nr:M4 family metallopeptidase [Bacteroidia bacterium]
TESPICNNSSANSWPVSTGIFGDGMQVNYGMRKTANFYASHFGWNSYDDAGGSLDCRVAYEFTDDNGNPTGNNARYDEFMEDFDFGYGATGLDAQDSYTCIDITGHEFTHGVDDYTADLDYQDESGALDESFADIFGELVEIYTEGPQPAGDAWKVANDKSTGSIRSMANPISFNDPDTYLGTNWYSGSNDNGGVHTNSGVQNHCFYLLCEGGSGFNSHGDYYDVNGIGTDDAKEIAFLAHQYLWGTAAFIDSRDAWLEAATDLYGSCSQQSIQTGNAWYAVGVGAQSPFNSKMVTGVQNALISHNTQEAIENVFSLGQVDINSVSGGPYEVRFFAGVDVTLSVGFTAASGSAFLADINPCSITLHTALRGTAPAAPVLPAAIAEQQGRLKLLAAPNPFSHNLQVRIEGMDGESEARLTVFDLHGKLVYSGTTLPLVEGAGEVLLDLSPLQQGLYFLEVNGSAGQHLRHKLVKLK